jgi:hypothetical protein
VWESCTNRCRSLRGVVGSCSPPVRHIYEFLTRILAAVRETSIPGNPGTGCGATGHRRVEGGGVSRGHRTAEAKAGRPEPVGCSSTPDPRPATQTPDGRVVGPEVSEGKHGGAQANLLEQILSRGNMRFAWKRVKAIPGAAGMDGMSIDALPACARQHGERLRSALEEGTYRPAAVRRVMMPKATGGQRPLGIPMMCAYCTSCSERSGSRGRLSGGGRGGCGCTTPPGCPG